MIRTQVVVAFPRRAVRPELARTLRRVGTVVAGAAAVLAFTAGALAVGPRFLPYQALPVLTGSMEPAIPTGSLAFVVPVRANEIAVGDVITFHHPNSADTYVTHRVTRVEGAGAARTFVTKGDANALEDAWQVKASGTGWRHTFGVPFIGGLIVAFAASPMRTLLFAVPLVALALMALVEIWRPRRENEVEPLAQAA